MFRWDMEEVLIIVARIPGGVLPNTLQPAEVWIYVLFGPVDVKAVRTYDSLNKLFDI